MKIGIVSDIHSNYWALQAMLRQERNIDTWICLGDMVGLLPMVNETLDLIRKSHMVAILGDHEKALLKGTPLAQSRSATQVLEMQKTMITAENRIFLETLSEKKHVRIGTLRCALVHSFDRLDAEHSYTIDIQAVEKAYPGDVIMYGHTHLPMVWYGKICTLINPGSLGFPIIKQKKHLYAVYDTDHDSVQFKDVQAETQKTINDCIKSKYPKRIIDLLKQQRV